MHRFFVDKDNITDEYITITGENVNHIKNVLRLKVGDEIFLCDGERNDYLVKIEAIAKDKVTGLIIDKMKSKGESDVEVILYQGMPKGSKMELIIQKATELGVSKIVPMISDRVVVKFKDHKKTSKKVDRWNKIALEASKQCNRGIVPKVTSPVKFKDVLIELKDKKNIIVPYENEENISIKSVLRNISKDSVNIVIGPEGGFEESEIENFKSINAKIVSLGSRILRTETAGIVTVALALYELEDVE
ncbi:16S rRNA (uracil(1498)-N(3))-methyltransferase [Clostridiisalibacter paucivorans]|uniref:16S rRNA (uracil(1498)-N(3))-methyltransferase n=1 Tax=Clostridiisalibacter paucivorans TaxID=408753 RepID=UPI00047C6F4C|nr:16S rRNA (uracil(1498)-N(3))-methyltransferase [Clostridiisalibacter paucivorans]